MYAVPLRRGVDHLLGYTHTSGLHAWTHSRAKPFVLETYIIVCTATRIFFLDNIYAPVDVIPTLCGTLGACCDIC